MKSNQKLFYGWIVVAVTAMVLLVSFGVRSSPGVFMLSLESDLGWSRASISAAVSLSLIILGISSPYGGMMVARFGPKRMTIVALAMMGITLIWSSQMTELWQLNVFWGGLLGLSGGLAGSVLSATVSNRWFVQHRGMVTGIFGAATSAGQLVFVPLLTSMLLSIGWRPSTMALGVISLLVLLPVLFLFKDDPADVGLLPLGATAPISKAQAGAEADLMARAVRHPDFWLLCVTFFICGATTNGIIGTHLIPYAVDCGIPQATAAGVVALLGTMNFVGTLASGWLTDRYDPRKLLCIYYGFRGLSLFLLPFVTDPLGLSVFAVIFGLDYISTVPPTIALAADSFGRRNAGVIYGWAFCAHSLGAALSAYLGGVTRDALGNYGPAFIAAGVLGICAAVLALRITRPASLKPLVSG
ncbi:MAG: MFS transporter [Anaerolineae bacterium]|nr:MFS transporter [Anaerolineae bacterium]